MRILLLLCIKWILGLTDPIFHLSDFLPHSWFSPEMLPAAADAAINDLADRVNGHGGIICLDAQGRVGFSFNTTHMARAWVTDGSPLQSAL